MKKIDAQINLDTTFSYKRPMGHIAHLRKQLKSINTWLYHTVNQEKKRRKTHFLLFEKQMVLHLNKLESPSPKDAMCKGCFKLAQWFWRRGFLEKTFKFTWCIFALSWLSPLGKKRGPSFEQNWIPFTQGCFVQVWLKLAQ